MPVQFLQKDAEPYPKTEAVRKVWNLAISAAQGRGNLKNLDPTSREAEECSAWYPIVVEIVQEASYWPNCQTIKRLDSPIISPFAFKLTVGDGVEFTIDGIVVNEGDNAIGYYKNKGVIEPESSDLLLLALVRNTEINVVLSDSVRERLGSNLDLLINGVNYPLRPAVAVADRSRSPTKVYTSGSLSSFEGFTDAGDEIIFEIFKSGSRTEGLRAGGENSVDRNALAPVDFANKLKNPIFHVQPEQADLNSINLYKPVEALDPLWKYCYKLPSDLLRVWHLGSLASFAVQGELLLTSEVFPTLYYARKVEDPAEWPSSMFQAVVYALASKIARPLTGKEALVVSLANQANNLLKSAQATALNSSGQAYVPRYTPDHITARGYVDPSQEQRYYPFGETLSLY